MTIEEINRLLKKEEGLNLEFKEAKTSVPRSLFETVVSFSNRDGGVILLGVNDEAFVTGIEPAYVKKFKTDIVTALNDRNCINPPIYLIPNDISHTNGLIIAIKVPASSQVHNHAGRIYWREADADLDITDNQDKVSSLYFQKRTYFSEIKIYPYLKIDDLDKALFDKA